MISSREFSGSQWKTALEKSRSMSLSGMYVFRSAWVNLMLGSVILAFWSISIDESIPSMEASLYRSARTCVELPGPHPRSTMRFGLVKGTLARRSFTGMVRSSSNLRYCFELQSEVLAAWEYAACDLDIC